MEPRKQKEIEYYEKKAEKFLKEKSEKKWQGDFEEFEPSVLSSYKFCYDWLKKNCKGKKVLDYGCGNGIHSIFPAKMGAEKVIGIDLSEKSLEIARERAKRRGAEGKVDFLKMDCEKMEFSDNFFDIIFDGGTFSSIDIQKAIPEMARVLKLNGVVIGIETLGHNPLLNFKRKINWLRGKRTKWATEHIFKLEDLDLVKEHFSKIEVHFFHLISWLAFPFLNLPRGKILLKLLEKMDKFLFKIAKVNKYAFKVVFVFSGVKK